MRKSGRIILLIVFFLLLAIGLIIFLFNTFTASGSSQEVFFDEEIRDITIKVENANVIMLSSENESTTIELSDSNNDSKLLTQLKGTQLTVEARSNSSFFDFGSSNPPVLTVHIPLANTTILKVNSGDGNLNLADIGPYEFEAYTANGDIAIQNVYAKYFSAETANGSIFMKDSAAQGISANSSNGDIQLENITSDVNLIAHSSNGSIEMKTEMLNSSIEFTTDNGDVTIYTENKPTQGYVEAKASNGMIDIFGDDSGNVSFGGEFPKLKVDVVNGDIVME